MPPHPLTNFEIQKYYQNEPKIDGVYSRNNLHKIKDGTSVINLDEHKLIETHLIAFYVNGDIGNASYFDSFKVEHISKEIKKFIENKNIMTNVYRIQAYNWIMCRYFCIGFNDFMLKGKSLLHYANLFSPREYENNDKIIPKYFQ